MTYYLVNGEQQAKINTSYSVIKAFREYFPGHDYRLLAKLAGSDWQRRNAIDHSFDLGRAELCKARFDCITAYIRIASISRRQAFRALAMFPHHIPIYETKIKESDWGRTNYLYVGTSLFLLNREYELGLAEKLKTSRWRHVEPYANLSELRYMLIRSMAEELGSSKHPLLEAKPAAIWLIFEGALCLRQSQTAEASYIGDYKMQKDYIDGLENVARDGRVPPIRYLESPQEILRNADICIDGLAAKLAKENPDFDKQRFKPYIAAQRRWNREKKKLGLLNPRRPGLKVGAKSKGNC